MDTAVRVGKRYYAYYAELGKWVCFMPDNLGGYHSYQIPIAEVPTVAIRTLYELDLITDAVYKVAIRGK